MNDDALKNLWKQQRADEPRSATMDPIATAKRRVSSFKRTIFWRDVRENLAALVIIGWFGTAFFTTHHPLARIGCVILVVSAFFIMIYPIWRKRGTKPAPDSSIIDSLALELKKVEIEIDLLSSVFWWYILPLSVGSWLFYFGLVSKLSSCLGFAGLTVGLDVFVYWLNVRAVRRVLVPLREELADCLSENPSPITINKPNYMGKLFILMATAALCFGVAKAKAATKPKLTSSEPAAIEQWLTQVAANYKLPSLAVAVVADGKIVVTNAVGLRKYNGTEKVTVGDKYHVGSITKSMTATVAAMLVEQKKIAWNTTIGEVFADFKDQINTNYLGVTLEQLLAQRAGFPGDAPAKLWLQAWQATGTPAEQRMAFAKGLLSGKPQAKPGTKFIYSNQGYAVAGVMLEKATGKTWEELMQTMLFAPLGMKSAGFGAPASPGTEDQPWGHKESPIQARSPVPPGPQADNPLAIAPAGAVHCSIEDLAKYAAFHLAGERGEGKLLEPATFKKLHTEVGDEYALGWMVLQRGWAKDLALYHNGSNTMFYAVVWIAPNRNFAVVVATNTGAYNAFEGCDDVASAMIGQFLK